MEKTMTRPAWLVAAVLLALPLVGRADPPAVAPAPRLAPLRVAATVETTLATSGNQIRQLAADGDPNTYFASEKNPTPTDHFTLVFDEPVVVSAVTVTTGRPGGGDALTAGILEVSADGTTFTQIAEF